MRVNNHFSGFTLLELLVVLVILGFAVSISSPRLWRLYEKTQERSVVQTFGDALQKLRLKAFHSGRTINLAAVTGEEGVAPKRMPALPDGWLLYKSTDIRLLANGVTNGGELYLRTPHGNRWLLTLQPLDGRVGIQRL